MHRSHIDPNGKDGVATGGGGMSSNGSLSGAASSASISGTDSIDGNGVGGNDSTANTLQDTLNEKLSKVQCGASVSVENLLKIVSRELPCCPSK